MLIVFELQFFQVVAVVTAQLGEAAPKIVTGDVPEVIRLV